MTHPDELIAAILRAGYEAVIVETDPNDEHGRGADSQPDPARQLDVDDLPADIVALLAKARAADKGVLLQFTGPG